MIVVIGSPAYDASADGDDASAVGLAAAIATASASTGATVQLVGRVGDDRAGDALLLALASRGVRHAAVIRDAGRPTRAATLVVADDGEPLVPVAPADDAAADRTGVATADVWSDGPTLDAGDLTLALGYLVDPRVLVVAEPLEDDAAAVVADAAAFADAALVAVLAPDRGVQAVFERATVLVAPTEDETGSFARLVGRFAAALDAGDEAAEAFDRARSAEGWEASRD